ncbi:MAG: zinc ribbon domain-containing protein [Dehalogenimonas sp.]|uniref:Zinc ribbon domain-containing protein n=1 Tax=Candidatus Dehalogenimonas loeffleri TaxID=3127115 RepID=A0ABZ2J2W6_9CHLR|nr:zinc ribbon domain-containing protein [Dehalogenimonas sp.]
MSDAEALLLLIIGIPILIVLPSFILGIIRGYRSNDLQNKENSIKNSVTFCVKCGRQLDTETVYCPKCGQQQTKTTSNLLAVSTLPSSTAQKGPTLGATTKGLKNAGIIFILGLIIWALGTGVFFYGLTTPYNPNNYTPQQLKYYGTSVPTRNTANIGFGAGLSILGFGLTIAGGINLLRKNK